MDIKLKTMADPINEGQHTLHDFRYVVTEDAEVEFSYQMSKDWGLSKGSIICEMTDCQNQKELATLFAAAPKLLEACENAEEVFATFGEVVGFPDMGPACWDAIEQLRHAIRNSEAKT